MSSAIFRWSFTLLLLVACTDDQPETAATDSVDSVSLNAEINTQNSGTPSDSAVHVVPDSFPDFLREWEHYWQTKRPGFSLAEFYTSGMSDISYENKYMMGPFTGYYSPDSSYCVDWINTGADWEPESYLWLYDFTPSHRKSCCLAVYSHTYYHTAGWADSTTFIVAGMDDWYENDAYAVPYYWVIDLSENSWTSYRSRKYFQVDPSRYRD